MASATVHSSAADLELNADGQVTHITAINAHWLLERDGALVATLRDGRRLCLGREDLAALVD